MNIQEIKVMLVTETKNQNNSIMMLLRNIISKYNVLEEQKGSKKIDVIEILNKEHKELNEELETCGWVRRITIQEQLNFLNQMLTQERMDAMAKFKDIIFEKNVAIHCPEEWMANELLKYANSKGYKWNIGESYNNTRWYVNKKSMCYLLGNGTHCGIDHVLNNKDLYVFMEYNDAVIKDETSLDYELIIKGRKAEIGSELWYKDEEWIENIFITGIFMSNKTRRINYKSKNRTGVIDVETMGDSLFWEKPIIYQLPDTDGNLSEVKIGQLVWSKWHYKTIESFIYKFEEGNILIKEKKHSAIYVVENKTGKLVDSKAFYATTNKPHKDFSDCPHWEDNPNAKYWGVNKNGESYFYEPKPTVILDYGYFVGWASDKHAGFRQDLLNEDGVVEDWEYSLVERPEGE